MSYEQAGLLEKGERVQKNKKKGARNAFEPSEKNDINLEKVYPPKDIIISSAGGPLP